MQLTDQTLLSWCRCGSRSTDVQVTIYILYPHIYYDLE